jgi:hypothetical protein
MSILYNMMDLTIAYGTISPRTKVRYSSKAPAEGYNIVPFSSTCAYVTDYSKTGKMKLGSLLNIHWIKF